MVSGERFDGADRVDSIRLGVMVVEQDFIPLPICCSHSRVSHTDHKFSPIGNPLGKQVRGWTDQRPVLADREVQAEKDISPIFENIFQINLVRASAAKEYYAWN